MTTNEAAQIMDLPADAAPDQVEARYHELRLKLEDKIARAPTPGLKLKYRESLEQLTAAFETLTLAADASALPMLRRTVAEPVAPVPPPVIPDRPQASSPPAARPGPTAGQKVLMHLVGCYKCCLLFGFMWAILFLLSALILEAQGVPMGFGGNDEEAGIIAGLAAELLAVLRPEGQGVLMGDSGTVEQVGVFTAVGAGVLGLLSWFLSVRRARRRLAEGKSNRRESIVAVSFTLLLALGGLTALLLALQSHGKQNEKWRLEIIKEVDQVLAEADKILADCAALEKTAQAELVTLEIRARSAAPDQLSEALARVTAQQRVVKQIGEILAYDPSRPMRVRLEGRRRSLADPKADVEALASDVQDLLYRYRDKVTNLRFDLDRAAPGRLRGEKGRHP